MFKLGLFAYISLLGIGMLLATAAPSWSAHAAPPDVIQGRALAEQWCSGCHQVSPEDPMNEVAPPFDGIAADPAATPDRFRTWLFSPHPAMPDFNLTYSEIKAIISYLESLKK
jgi:mono/diheme cytochrome c family protein